jgi:hypothetical protein
MPRRMFETDEQGILSEVLCAGFVADQDTSESVQSGRVSSEVVARQGIG